MFLEYVSCHVDSTLRFVSYMLICGSAYLLVCLPVFCDMSYKDVVTLSKTLYLTDKNL